jgi:hypothetical protein
MQDPAFTGQESTGIKGTALLVAEAARWAR